MPEMFQLLRRLGIPTSPLSFNWHFRKILFPRQIFAISVRPWTVAYHITWMDHGLQSLCSFTLRSLSFLLFSCQAFRFPNSHNAIYSSERKMSRHCRVVHTPGPVPRIWLRILTSMGRAPYDDMNPDLLASALAGHSCGCGHRTGGIL